MQPITNSTLRGLFKNFGRETPIKEPWTFGEYDRAKGFLSRKLGRPPSHEELFERMEETRERSSDADLL